jgi:hypothetical protein
MANALDLVRKYAAEISALTALVAVFVGPLVTYLIARRQLFGNLIALNRIRWVEDLRVNVAEFVAVYAAHLQLIREWRAEKDTTEKSKLRTKVAASAANTSRLRALLRLRLNPQEDKHRELLELLDRSLENSDLLLKGKPATMPLREFGQSIIEVSRRILKTEWDRAKKLG